MHTGAGDGVDAMAEHARMAYGVRARRASLLPGREHAEAAGYRLDCEDGPRFLKLSPSPPANLALVRHLADAGVRAVLPPLRARDGSLCVRMGRSWATLYPFVDGEDGFRAPLSLEQWTELGAAVRAVHETALPPAISGTMRVESFAPTWRRKTREYLAGRAVVAATDEVARRLRTLLGEQRARIEALVGWADDLAAHVRAKALPRVPCHGDLHAGNVLVARGGGIFIVDWDDPVLAPKERDLMFVGAGIGGTWNEAWEAAAFYAGYGTGAVDAEAVAYYRCDRIVEDVALFCDRLLGDAGGSASQRVLILEKLTAAFGPGDVVEIAERTVAAL